MSARAAITVNRPRQEVERLWRGAERDRGPTTAGSRVTFTAAPADRGTEIHVELDRRPRAGRLGEAFQKLTGSDPVAEAKDELRRFKQKIETGVIARSEGTPEGELAARKLKQRPAQPLEGSELDRASG